MFEVGKLTDEMLDSFLIELNKVSVCSATLFKVVLSSSAKYHSCHNCPNLVLFWGLHKHKLKWTHIQVVL